jgi:hypothetical protein
MFCSSSDAILYEHLRLEMSIAFAHAEMYEEFND